MKEQCSTAEEFIHVRAPIPCNFIYDRTGVDADSHFGASVQLTGPVANTGRYYKDAYEFAAEKINAAGGITIGSARHKIALKVLDNRFRIPKWPRS
jgi:ABC-type branched-subunit amino acid transport system substrate-binding protein